MVYVIQMCTLPVLMSKIPSSEDSQVQEVQVQKAILYHLSQWNGSKFAHDQDSLGAWKACPKLFAYALVSLL